MSIEPNVKFRIFPDGTVMDEVDFEEHDNSLPNYDDYQEVEVPQLVFEHIADCAVGK